MSADFYNPSQEHLMLRNMVNDFAKEQLQAQAADYDRNEKFNLEVFRQLGDLGLLGITVSEDFGGSAMDATAAVIAHEELASVDPGFCLAYLAHSMLCVNNFYVNANDEQRKKILPKMCSGEFIGAMAMSEPDVGTDVMGMSAFASLEGDIYKLNGRKMWITNGCLDDEGTPCDGVLVYAKTGDLKSNQVSTFMVLKEHEGFSVGQKIKDKLGMRASNTAELVFQDCQVPKAWLIGEEGDSMKHMMRNLEIERLALAAMSLGIARRSLDIMTKYAGEREAFKQPLNRFGQIQKYIAESYAEYKAARAFVYQTAAKLDPNGSGERIDSDAVKLFASTMGKNISDRAIQVLGGYGYVGEYNVERLWRDAKLLEIGGGTLEAHHKNISRDLAKSPELIHK